MTLSARRRRDAAEFKVAITEHDTLDAAIADALSDLEDGGVVVIHSEACEQRDEDEGSCTCTPLEIKKGAKA